MSTTRRDFLKIAGMTAAALALPKLSSAAPSQAVAFEACVAMTPTQMAETSPMVKASWAYLRETTASIRNAQIQALVTSIYNDSAPQLAQRLDAAQRKAIWEELVAKGYTDQPQETFLPPVPDRMAETVKTIAAPGSGYASHHAYPGGLITHVAANVVITDGIINTYQKIYDYAVDRDIALAAQLLHDLHKPYVFQWQSNGASRTEQKLAGTGEHHVLSLAELIVRNAPAQLVVAQACAHTHPGTPNEEKHVVGWLKAASIIAGVDPVRYGLLEASGETLPLPRRQEGFICHLGDHDFVLSVPAVQWTLPVMQAVARKSYKLSETDVAGRPFNALRNMVYSRCSAMRLENIYAQEGAEGVRKAMLAVVAPMGA